MTAAPDKCPKCYLPMNPHGSGSLTQWLSSCACDRPKELPVAADDDVSVNLCKVCGKRARQGRVGSFTQFVFRYDLCACGAPEIAAKLASLPQQTQPDFAGPFDDDSEPSLEVDVGEFPIERYKPIQLVGKGASGSVYACKDRLLNKKVAVKVLHRLSKEDILAFQREANVLSKLEHPGIVRLLDFGVSGGGSPFMVLEFAEGISLRQRLDEEGPLTWEESRWVFAQLAKILIYCHERMVFHRDLKPENILFVNQEGNSFVKLIDFGIAFEKRELPDGIENSSNLLAGTPAYMAPDQALGIEYSARSEIYSFGCVVYETLTGRPPFVADTTLKVLSMHAGETAAPLSNYIEVDTTQAEKFLSKCLAKTPTDRFFSMKRVLEALRKDVPDYSHDDRRDESLPEPILAAPPVVPNSGDKSKLIVLAATLLVLGLGTVAVLRLSQNTPAVEDRPIDLYEADSKVLNTEDEFSIEEFGPGAYRVSGVIGKDAFEKIAKLKIIKRLQVSPMAKLDWKLLPMLRDVRLAYLELNFSKLDDNTVAYLLPLRHVKHLDLSETKITDEGVRTLVGMRRLKVLELSNTHVTGRCLKYLGHHRFLTALIIQGIQKVTTDDLYYLGNLTTLSKLDISSSPIDTRCARLIGRMNLAILEANDCNLTDSCVAFFRSAPLIRLSIGGNPDLTDRTLETIQEFRDLRFLKITGLPKVSQAAINKLKRIRPDIAINQETEFDKRMNKMEELLDVEDQFLKQEKVVPQSSEE